MDLQNIIVRQARLVPFTTTAGKQSTYYELSLVHGQRVSTQYDAASGQRVTVYGPSGQPMMKDDVLTLEYYGSDAASMQQLAQQLQIIPGCVCNLTLHSFNTQSRATGRWQTQWMLPENVQVVSYPQPAASQQPAYAPQQGYAPAQPQPNYPSQQPQQGFQQGGNNAPWG